MKQRRFTKEFEAGAVRLVHTSGRTQREVADDLGIGLSTRGRWIGRSRDRLIEEPPKPGSEDVAAELKRLRRENKILRQERDILKKATGFFAKDGVRPGAPLPATSTASTTLSGDTPHSTTKALPNSKTEPVK